MLESVIRTQLTLAGSCTLRSGWMMLDRSSKGTMELTMSLLDVAYYTKLEDNEKYVIWRQSTTLASWTGVCMYVSYII